MKKPDEPQLSVEMEKRFVDEAMKVSLFLNKELNSIENVVGNVRNVEINWCGMMQFLATALEEQRKSILSEVEKLQEVWEKTFIDSKKEGNNGDIWRGGVLALGELQAKLNQLKEEGK